MDLVIIGSGNVATALGTRIRATGHRILQVVARNEISGKKLATQFESEHTSDLSGINTEAQIYIVAVSDSALPQLAGQLRLRKGVIVHTAGSVPLDVFKGTCSNYGVLYPLQTLNASQQQVPEFPLLVDANTPDTLTLLFDLAESISGRVVHANDEYRRKIHLAAVVTGNFTNHLFALIQDYCRKNDLDFQLLLPHIEQVVANLEKGHAATYQTGPAVRNDVETLNRHLAMLGQYPDLSKIYQVMTGSIKNYHQIKDIT